jgi:amino acid permease
MLYLSEKTKKFSFKDIAVVVFNKHVGNIFEGTNLLFNVGGIIGYVVVIGQLGYPVALQLFDAFGIRKPPISIFLLIIMATIVFPLCCLRHISILSYTRFVGCFL